MAKKTVVVLVFLLCLIFTGLQSCSAADLQRVAILPVSFSHSYVDQDVEAVISKALANKFHTPLANIVPVFQIIPKEEVQKGLITEVGAKKIQAFKLDKNLLKNIAVKTNADIVIGVEVTQFWTMQTITFYGDILRETNLAMKVLIYHKPTEMVTEKKDYDNYAGDEILWGQPEYMADQMIFKLLNKIPDYSGYATPAQDK
ncbi:MAG: hypothetical protein H6Q65_2355 [Firmicutes bacterium]|nr:hypothetical protein [Bacillota bacterium]